MAGIAQPATLHVRETRGRHNNWRWAIVWMTQVVYYGLPWLHWDGRPAILLDFPDQKFFLFGMVLLPQDLIYLSLWLVVCALVLFLSATLVNRIWCGFTCPHTVYTEIFMWVERKIEGGRSARLKLQNAALSVNKIRKKLFKHAVWVLLAGWTGLTFVGYFTPIREILPAMLEFSIEPWVVFWLLAYGMLAYVNAGWMREQVCRVICPYSRFQGAMLDKNTLLIAYDELRGEPRGLRNRKQAPNLVALGDCVDCTLCVQVCPVGIDIRQGFQHDCTACGACMDACDLVMDKIGASKGLIRYTNRSSGVSAPSESLLFWRSVSRPRVWLYLAGIVLASVIMAFALQSRVPLKLEISRDRHVLGDVDNGGQTANVYQLQIMNADAAGQWYRIEAEGLRDGILIGRELVWIQGLSSRTVAVRVQAPRAGLVDGVNQIHFRVQALNDEQTRVTGKGVFFALPAANKNP